RCGEDKHHSHVICIKCKEIAFGIFAKCECNKFRREKSIDQIDENNRSCSDEELRRFSSSTRKTCEVQDACFITATVFEKDINVMLDTGSFSSVITKMYLDKMNIDIEKPANVKIIDINGNKKAPLGKVNVPVVINNDKWIIEMIVTDSRNYNVILGNQWIGKVGGILNFNDGIFSYENNNERDSTLMTCWQRMSNPNILYEIQPIKQIEEYDLELEEDDEDEDIERIFFENEDRKEQRFMKAQIEEGDTLLQITEDKKTVTGNLNDEQKGQLQKLLQEYEDIIAKEGELGRTKVYKHPIITEDVYPVCQRAYRTTPEEDQVIKKEIDRCLEKNLI